MTFTNENMAFADYLFAFTDDVGIFQHRRQGTSDRNFGYTTDDNIFKCFNEYKGVNSKGLSLIDKETGACYDDLKTQCIGERIEIELIL